MSDSYWRKENLTSYFFAFIILILICIWLKSLSIQSEWQRAGLLNLSLGAVMLLSHIIARILKTFRLPLISGYIFTGIFVGPYVSGFLSSEMVHELRLVNDLALSFIALAAGGSLHLPKLKKSIKVIALSIISQTVVVFFSVLFFVVFFSGYFGFTRQVPSEKIWALAILLGVIAVARSPSSAIAIINECKAKGPFSETVLGVTVAMDVLIIVLFTIAMTFTRWFIGEGSSEAIEVFTALFLEIVVSFFLGVILGKGISLFMEHVGYDLALFLFFIALGTSRFSLALDVFMEARLGISMHFEPLLICMSAGFFVQNFTPSGFFFTESLEKFALPIFVLFFCLAGASLNLYALMQTWPLALCIVFVRMGGIFGATWFAGHLAGGRAKENRLAWMAYLTQAGVSIGLAQLAQRQFPQIGIYLSTVVLAVITVNQIIGPITFKMALHLVGEARRE